MFYYRLSIAFKNRSIVFKNRSGDGTPTGAQDKTPASAQLKAAGERDGIVRDAEGRPHRLDTPPPGSTVSGQVFLDGSPVSIRKLLNASDDDSKDETPPVARHETPASDEYEAVAGCDGTVRDAEGRLHLLDAVPPGATGTGDIVLDGSSIASLPGPT